MKIGIPLVFSGILPQVVCISEVLENLGFDVITSKITTPELWEKALFLGSNETCLPVRIYIAHCHKLVFDKSVDVLIAPNIWREIKDGAACAKYRDVGGISLRALSSTTDYALKNFPLLIQPNIISPKKEDLLPVLFEIYKELTNTSISLNKPIPSVSKKEIAKALSRSKDFRKKREISLDDKPRIGIIGRRYLLEDPLLSLNIIKFFKNKNFQVITPYDLPERYLSKENLPFGSYYDTHILGEQFLNWGKDKLSGVVILSCFACHPDAFQGQYLEEKAKELGLLSWHFVCDSTVDLGGFITRFETISSLINEKHQNEANVDKHKTIIPISSSLHTSSNKLDSLSLKNEPKQKKARTIVTWPYMGEPLNLALKQLAYDLGINEQCIPPKPVTEKTLKLGSEELAETCCPYALISGSLEETIIESYNQYQNPINVQILMLHGEGPCAFGWYSIAMKEKLPNRLARISDDIKLNWITTGVDQPVEFWQDIAKTVPKPEKQRLLNDIKTPLSFFKPNNFLESLALLRNAFTKLRLAESLRALYLVSRPFGGNIAEEVYHTALISLDRATCVKDMYKSMKNSRATFESITKGREAPSVIVVGEIYVALTPYANRYTVDRLLGDAGVSVVEGITIEHYLSASLRPLVRRFLNNLIPIKLLNKQGLKLFAQGLRDMDSTPFLNFEVGGDGVLTVGAAKRAVKSGIDGIVQIYPLNCMPEVIAKPAVSELASLYDVPYLALSFNRETDTERLMTEVLTFTRIIKAKSNASPVSLA